MILRWKVNEESSIQEYLWISEVKSQSWFLNQDSFLPFSRQLSWQKFHSREVHPRIPLPPAPRQTAFFRCGAEHWRFSFCPQLSVAEVSSQVSVVKKGRSPSPTWVEIQSSTQRRSVGQRLYSWCRTTENTGAPVTLVLDCKAVVPHWKRKAKKISGSCPLSTSHSALKWVVPQREACHFTPSQLQSSGSQDFAWRRGRNKP